MLTQLDTLSGRNFAAITKHRVFVGYTVNRYGRQKV